MFARHTVLMVLTSTLVVVAASPAIATPGDALWTKTYDGPASARDTPRGAVVDPVLNRLYVVGTATVVTRQAGDLTDIITIAYDLQDGHKIWQRRYDGGLKASDLGVAIAYDAFSGGVIVLGASDTIFGGGQPRAVTIAYNVDGSRRWVRRVKNVDTDLPVNLVVANGWTFVLVHSVHGRLIAYDPSGTKAWAATVTTGDLTGLVDLDEVGGYLIAVGTLSDGAGGSAMLTTAFDPNGTLLWTRRFAGPTSHAGASEADVGTDGTIVYVTGTYRTDTSQRITTIAYDPHDGFRFWRRSIPPQAPDELDLAPHIAVSDDGGSIVVSTGSRLNNVDTFLTRQYGGDGSTDWTARENGPGESGQTSDVAIGPDGKVYVTGLGTNSGATPGAFTLAYPQTGPPSLFEAPIPNVDREDAAFVVVPSPLGDRVFVASRVNLDIRVDAYATT